MADGPHGYLRRDKGSPQCLVEAGEVDARRERVFERRLLGREDCLRSREVSIATGHVGYPAESPYSPSIAYPEYCFGSETLAEETNDAYEGVREALHLLQLDEEHYGRKDWNPLGQVIRPGDTVVLKPNFVREFRETRPGLDDCTITHGAIIRAAVDYAYIALKGTGRIIIADAPQGEANFDEICRIAGLDRIQDLYRRYADVEVEVYDLRPERSRTLDGALIGYEPLPGDPRGYATVDLGIHSMFVPIEHLCRRVYGSDHHRRETRRHHTGGVHEYSISRTVLEADCVINLPKLKTHKKTGLTVCLKNMVGINGKKNWLPHLRLGTPAQGGDQFADDGLKHRVERYAMACFRRVVPWLGPVRTRLGRPLQAMGKHIFGDTNTDMIRSGNWHGNDTAWRMVLDLNRAILYADRSGNLRGPGARNLFCIVDGIVGGEGNGPLDATPKAAGVVVAGRNPVAVELACALVMGFDRMQLPLLCHALDRNHSAPLLAFGYDEIICKSPVDPAGCPLSHCDILAMSFRPHFGWRGKIERNRRQMYPG
ncbi:MAG: DUF362 domain-containing protein [Planctomycetota bacterium]|nr:DUF362 domain-containing protein [Planctomycetota bacterium]